MKSKSALPDYLQTKVSQRLQGYDGHEGLVQLLHSLESERASLKRQMACFLEQDDLNQLDVARLKYADMLREVDQVKIDLKCWESLANDSRMVELVKILNEHAVSEQEQCIFIEQAAASLFDYSTLRANVKKAVVLLKQIEKNAGQLSENLAKLSALAIPSVNSELSSLRELISHTMGDADLTWRVEAKKLLEGLDNVYSWSLSPSVSSIVGQIGSSAEDCYAYHTGKSGAALSARKDNTKTQYLRAFGFCLRENGFERSKELYKAIAIIANIVLNSGANTPDISSCIDDFDVTYDDVRKALSKE
ncbi:hypothetical protein KO528_17980 [Saccharophagus degradans]|uniref:hypothetical protein n=1 Tax=Saccharophagus degradans TaxID=86304 RepID=UPI001C08727C|nr:hypothetical protein [Saccharophagus degradans]MBU2987259.1 hypothetical protein [Saccharophagus degradans]